MAKRRTIGIAVIVICALVLGVVGILIAMKAVQTKETRYISTSWGENYGDVKALSEASNLIALAEITGIKSVIEEDGIPYTTFTAKVEKPVYQAKQDETFDIYMTGGETKDEIVEVENDPLLKRGDKVLVFCKENSDGTYQILSGPQGRLVYSNGKLNSVVANNAIVQDADLDELISEIEQYVENK